MALQKKKKTKTEEEDMDDGREHGTQAQQKLLPFLLLDPRSLQLQLWSEEEATLRRAADMEEELCRGGHKELHRLFAMFAAFQGVLFSALLVLQQQEQQEEEEEQRNARMMPARVSCAPAFLPMALTALLSGGAAAMALLHKGREVGALRREMRAHRRRADGVYGLMESLAAGVLELDAADDAEAEAEAAAAAHHSRRFSSFFCVQGSDLLLYVACLTLLMLLCCTAILCTACNSTCSQTPLQP